MRKNFKSMLVVASCLTLSLGVTACSKSESDSSKASDEESTRVTLAGSNKNKKSAEEETTSAKEEDSKTDATKNDTDNTKTDTSEYFTERDLKQTVDTSEATSIELKSGENTTISEEGIYVITGDVTETSIIVDTTDDNAKVQLVLDGVTIKNTSTPAIYVKSADKVFVTTTDSENTLEVTSEFTADGDTNTDAVIFSKDDLVLNGVGTLNLTSTDNGIAAKDDFKMTGGTLNITAEKDGIEVNDSIAICDGTVTIDSGKDALHCENDKDNTLGSIYISGGTFDITAGDDGIQGTTTLTIDGGTIDVKNSVEGLEATNIEINDGDISIYATDDGINASEKSTALDIEIVINGGNIDVEVGPGDTDAIDSNGSITVNGGTINITAQMSSFDYETTGVINGGTVTVNGEQVTEMPQSMMGGGGMHGGMQGRGGRGQMPSGEDFSNSGDRPQMPEDGESGERPEMPDDTFKGKAGSET